MVGKITILSEIRGQRSSNCTTATKGENSRNMVGIVAAIWFRLIDSSFHMIGKGWAIYYFLDRDAFFWSKFTCDNMSYWQCPRFAVNLNPPYWEGVAVDWPATMCRGSAFGGFRHGDGFAFGEIVLDLCITFLYTWDINRFPPIRHQ